MPDREQLEALFVKNLPVIDRAVAGLCRRYGVPAGEVAEVDSWVRARFVEDSYAALAKFRGESSLSTYLTVVVAMLFRDYRAQRWGRWRPSAAAQRRGAVAVRLETLVVRDRLPLRQAAEMLRTRGETDLGERELAQLLQRLPPRDPIRPVEVAANLDMREDPGRADAALWNGVAAGEQSAMLRRLQEAIDNLPAEDQVVLTLRFWEDMSVADVARVLHLEQKPLYRRLERLLGELRAALERVGVSAESLAFLAELQEAT